jgi:hypothetical protein
MRSFGRSALVVAILALAATATAIAGGPTTVTQSSTVGVLGGSGVDTGFVLANGETVTVTATGSLCPFGAGGPCFGPGGNPGWDTTSSSYGGFVLPGAPAWGLVGRVGSGSWVQIGSGPTTLSGTGSVQFAANDDFFADNAGGFSVTLSYKCWPGWGWGDKNHRHCGPPGLAIGSRAGSGPKKVGHEQNGRAVGASGTQGNSGHEPNGRAVGASGAQGNSGHEPNGNANGNAAPGPDEHANANAGSGGEQGHAPKGNGK